MKGFGTNKKTASVMIAKDRLKVLLVSDRVNCTPDALEKMKNEFYKIVSKYFEVVPDEFEISIDRSEILIKFTGENL